MSILLSIKRLSQNLAEIFLNEFAIQNGPNQLSNKKFYSKLIKGRYPVLYFTDLICLSIESRIRLNEEHLGRPNFFQIFVTLCIN